MTEIKSVVEFNELVSSFRSRNGKILTNCFLMPDEISHSAQAGKLFAAECPGWLIIISDTTDYSNLYYYTTEDSDVEALKKLIDEIEDRELFIDIVTKNTRGDTHTPARLISAGIAAPYKKYIRLQQFVRNMDFDKYDTTLAEGYFWADDYDDYDEAMKLWKLGLDEKSIPLPTRESFKKHKQDGSIFFIVDDKNDLAAVYLASISGNQALLQHLSVSPNHRRKRLGDTMIFKSFHYSKDHGVKKFIFWAFEENVPIITLMKRHGFVEDGTLCEQLIVKK